MPRPVLDIREETRALRLSDHDRAFALIITGIAVLMLLMMLLAK
jgi:hypothetical protein